MGNSKGNNHCRGDSIVQQPLADRHVAPVGVLLVKNERKTKNDKGGQRNGKHREQRI